MSVETARPMLFLLCGKIASGKSTLAAELARQPLARLALVRNPDVMLGGQRRVRPQHGVEMGRRCFVRPKVQGDSGHLTSGYYFIHSVYKGQKPTACKGRALRMRHEGA